MIVNRVTRSPVLIAWLPDASDVDHGFRVGEFVLEVNVWRCEELMIGGENSRRMRVALKGITLDQREETFHLSRTVGIVWEHIFVDGVRNGSMDVDDTIFGVDPGKFREETQSILRISRLNALFDLLSCPEDGLFSHCAETFGVNQRTIVMVADDAHLHGHHDVKAFAGIWAVPNDITETKNAFAPLRLNVGQNCGEGFKVPVDIANDCRSQSSYSPLPPLARYLLKVSSTGS